jgi:signal transduction histidine kinase
VLAHATEAATAGATAAQSSSGTASVRGVIIGAAIAAVALIIAQTLTHFYTARRERRAELADVIDRVVSTYNAGDRAIVT